MIVVDSNYFAYNTSGGSKYNFPNPGEGKYFFGTDVEKLYSHISGSNIYSKSANELKSDVDTIANSISRVQDSIDSWLGNSSQVEVVTMNEVIDNMKIVLNNVSKNDLLDNIGLIQ